jgi:hypothetical protein
MENVGNHGLQYRSGMLQSWNKFCFTSGYIKVSMALPGHNSETQEYMSYPLFFCDLDSSSIVVAWWVDYGQPWQTRLQRENGWCLALHVSSAL